jgi:hypothetical protein
MSPQAIDKNKLSRSEQIAWAAYPILFTAPGKY